MGILSPERVRELRVMVVDDDRPTRLLVRAYLEHLHFADVIERDSGEAALKDLSRRHFDLVVTDIEMQDLGGIELLLRIWRDPDVMNPYMPVVLMTQNASRDYVVKARDCGASAFVAKPLHFESLQRTIETVLTDKRSFIKVRSYAGPDRRRQDKTPRNGKYQRESDYTW